MLRTAWCCCRMCGWTGPTSRTGCTPSLPVSCWAGGWVGVRALLGWGLVPTGCTPSLRVSWRAGGWGCMHFWVGGWSQPAARHRCGYGCCVAWAIGWPGRAVCVWTARGQGTAMACATCHSQAAHIRHPPPFPATGFSQLEQPPSLFVLMGNFQVGGGRLRLTMRLPVLQLAVPWHIRASCAGGLIAAAPSAPPPCPQSFDANPGGNPGSSGNVGHYARLREHFASLGRIINQYPAIRVGGWNAFVLAAPCAFASTCPLRASSALQGCSQASASCLGRLFPQGPFPPSACPAAHLCRPAASLC